MTPAGLWKGDEDEFGVVLATQWPARRRLTGAGALGLALLTGAIREAGLLALGPSRVRPRARVDARAWLAGATDGSELVPLAMACALAGLNPDRVVRAVRQRVGPP
jgi:hypothetical protein